MSEMFCICCNKKLEKVFGENLQPSGAVHFSSLGHYGSTYFDPMDGSTLNIFVCDTCLEKNQDRLIRREKMNPRIRELYEQAQDWADNQNFFESEYSDYMMEKFAQLIVEQCAGIIESQDVDPSFKLRLSWAVKQYFGVDQ